MLGKLPIGNELGYIEVLDNGKELEGAEVVGKTIHSIEKHADYDFTLHESIIKSNGGRVLTRKLHFQFSEDCADLKIECTKVCSFCKAPVTLYFRQ